MDLDSPEDMATGDDIAAAQETPLRLDNADDDNDDDEEEEEVDACMMAEDEIDKGLVAQRPFGRGGVGVVGVIGVGVDTIGDEDDDDDVDVDVDVDIEVDVNGGDDDDICSSGFFLFVAPSSSPV